VASPIYLGEMKKLLLILLVTSSCRESNIDVKKQVSEINDVVTGHYARPTIKKRKSSFNSYREFVIDSTNGKLLKIEGHYYGTVGRAANYYFENDKLIKIELKDLTGAIGQIAYFKNDKPIYSVISDSNAGYLEDVTNYLKWADYELKLFHK
jgi:hypothetical protein